MPTIIGTLARAATRRAGRPLNVLTFPTHERYETGLCLTGHNFHAVRGPGIKDWNAAYAPVPANYLLLDPAKGSRQFPEEADYDLVLSQNRFGQYHVAAQISRQLHLPLVSLEHTLPVPDWPEGRVAAVRRLRGHVNVFISGYSVARWGWDQHDAVVIEHGVDAALFRPPAPGTPREAVALSVVNDWANRDWCCGHSLWREGTAGLPVRVLGDNPGMSRPPASVAELAAAYRKARVFVNTSLVSPIPTALLEAMASGCAVVTTGNCMIPEAVQDGENGLIADTPAAIRTAVERLLDDQALALSLGEKARATVLAKFGMDRFVREWDTLLRRAADVVYSGPPGRED